MIYYEIRQKNGEIIASNIQKCPYFDLFKENRNLTLRKQNLKSGFKENEDVSVWLIIHNEKDILNSNKIFKKTMEIYTVFSMDFLNFTSSRVL